MRTQLLVALCLAMSVFSLKCYEGGKEGYEMKECAARYKGCYVGQNKRNTTFRGCSRCPKPHNMCSEVDGSSREPSTLATSMSRVAAAMRTCATLQVP